MLPSRKLAAVLVFALSAAGLGIVAQPAEPATPPAKFAPQHLISPQPGTEAIHPRIVSPATPIVPRTTPAIGTARVPVIPIEFTDVPHSPAYSPTAIASAFNDAAGNSVNAYYREASYGQLMISATVVNWVGTNQLMGYYGQDSASGVDDASGPIYRLVTEAVRLADAAINFATFDDDGDGVLDHLVIVHAGNAQESSGQTSDVWSHRWVVIDANPSTPVDEPLMADGVQVYGYIMVSESSPIGVASHELGHDFGLPDLYDTDGPSKPGGVGKWDIMATGSWNGVPAGTTPAHFSAWSKIFLGWETPVEVTSPILPASIERAETTPRSFRLSIRSNGAGEEYFLVENRQQVGFDSAVPGSGLLIWHVDTTVANNDDDLHRLVDLEEADEAISGDSPEDRSDPWADSPDGFGPGTTPNSNGYGNVQSGWRVRNIGASSASMTADISKTVQDDLAVSRIGHPVAARPGQIVTVTVEVGDRGNRTPQPSSSVEATIYRDAITAGSEVPGFPSARPTPPVTPGSTVSLAWTFTPTAEGRYIVRGRVILSGDEIPENNERIAAFQVRNFQFYDDVESGAGNWTMNGAPNDAFRWSIVDDGMPEGSSHSPTHAWRFGYLGAFPPSLVPPRYHLLTSEPVGFPAGRLYLALYHRYDLTGSAAYPGRTDDGWVQVSLDGGPWMTVRHVTGKDLTWRPVVVDLTATAAGASTLVVRFNATADVLSQEGGWWIDDVLVTTNGLGPAVAIISVLSDRSIEPGATASFVLKVVNIGDVDDSFSFRAPTMPPGWSARLAGNSSLPVAVSLVPPVSLAPNAEATFQFQLVSPPDVVRGTVATVPLVAQSSKDPTVTATFGATARINDPIGLGTLLRYAPYLVGLFIVLAVIVLVIDAHKRKKFQARIR